MVRIRGRIGDWPVDLTLELDAQEWASLSSAVAPVVPVVPVVPDPAVQGPAPVHVRQDSEWQAVLELVRRAGRIEGPQLLEKLSALAGSAAAGKRLLVRLRHCEQVRMETGTDAPVYCWLENTGSH